jgi:transposase InsO family protein
MLSPHALIQLCHHLGLSEQAQAVIETIRSAPPARRVRSAAGNVAVRYPSRKMGRIIQAESHRNELAGIYEYEYDPATLEFYDQPPAIKLIYRAKTERQVGVWHTPDYFVLRTDSVGWEEWKTEAHLLQLAQTMPHRYVRDDQSGWSCPPGERYAEPLGFVYRVRSSAEIDWILQRNLLFLEDYLRGDGPAVRDDTATAIQALVAQRPGIPLDELLGCLEGTASDAIYGLIATHRLYVDLRAMPLAEPERVCVFRDEATAQAYAVMGTTAAPPMGTRQSVSLEAGLPVVWDGQLWTIVNVGETMTALLSEDGSLVELPPATVEALIGQGTLIAPPAPAPVGISAEARARLTQASPDDFREANRRYAIIAPRLAGAAPVASTTPARTIRFWLAQWREAEQVNHCGYVGLLPRLSQSGNRQPKLPAATRQLLDVFIATDYETLKQKPQFEVYAALVRACDEQALRAPSYKTFTQAVSRRPRQEQAAKRQGPRAARAEGPFYWELTLTTPRHGDRPFEIGHIDHTQLDIQLVCSRTGRPLGRPWSTFLTDAWSRRLLAVSLGFDPPSYRACMLILRECVHRHHRLPQTVVVDGGPEFASVYFETLLARYECTKKTRPGAAPRFGSVCERLFGTTNTRFIHTLAGNTQLLQHGRQVTGAVAPKAQACWTLGRLWTYLCTWAYEVYDTLEHPALGQSPREAFASGLLQSGQRPQRLIADDEDFRMLTLPTTRKGTATVQPRLGVKINHLYYWSDAFLDPVIEGTQVPIRFDPFDAGLAYAFVGGHWMRCISEYHAAFAGRSEREIQLATAELRRRRQRHGQQLCITAHTLAAFLVSLEAEEVLLEQRLRDAEAKDVRPLSAGGEPAGGTPRSAASGAPLASPPPPSASTPPEAGLVVYEDYD